MWALWLAVGFVAGLIAMFLFFCIFFMKPPFR
jgi:hypothetical protein